ncbi:MAG: hypothetical protein WBA68_02650 [Alteraurantiacibacter sp.]
MSGTSVSRVLTTQDDLSVVMSHLGWHVSPGSGPVAERRVAPDRVCHAVLSKLAPVFPFSLNGWVTTDALSAAFTLIKKPRARVNKSCPLERSYSFIVDGTVATPAQIER